MAALSDEEKPRARHGEGDGAEGLDDPLHVLFAIEAAHVETERRVLHEAETPPRRSAIARTEEIEGDTGGHDRDLRLHTLAG